METSDSRRMKALDRGRGKQRRGREAARGAERPAVQESRGRSPP